MIAPPPTRRWVIEQQTPGYWKKFHAVKEVSDEERKPILQHIQSIKERVT